MDLGSVSAAAGVNPQVQAAATGKAYDAQKQEGKAAIQLIESASEFVHSHEGGGPQATGNNVDVIV